MCKVHKSMRVYQNIKVLGEGTLIVHPHTFSILKQIK
jgi:hypothetical protein